jgi:hypothetical protein
MRAEVQHISNTTANGGGAAGTDFSSPPRARSSAVALPDPVVVASARYVLLPLAHLLTGYTVKAIQRKIERGDWQEGKIWRHAPDGHIVVDMTGYERWVEGR